MRKRRPNVPESSRAVYHSAELRRLAVTEQGAILLELARVKDATILELERVTNIPSSTVSARLDELVRDRKVFRDVVNKRPCGINGKRKITFRLAKPNDLVQISLWERKAS